MKFLRPEHKITIVDWIFITLIIVAIAAAILLNETKIIAVVIVISLISVNVRDYIKKRRKNKIK
jgi:hypothetical protein